MSSGTVFSDSLLGSRRQGCHDTLTQRGRDGVSGGSWPLCSASGEGHRNLGGRRLRPTPRDVAAFMSRGTTPGPERGVVGRADLLTIRKVISITSPQEHRWRRWIPRAAVRCFRRPSPPAPRHCSQSRSAPGPTTSPPSTASRSSCPWWDWIPRRPRPIRFPSNRSNASTPGCSRSMVGSID